MHHWYAFDDSVSWIRGGHIIALIVLLHVYGDLLHQCLRMQILFWPHFTIHLKCLHDWEFAFGCEEKVGVILTTAELGLCERIQRIFTLAHILTIIEQIGYLFGDYYRTLRMRDLCLRANKYFWQLLCVVASIANALNWYRLFIDNGIDGLLLCLSTWCIENPWDFRVI